MPQVNDNEDGTKTLSVNSSELHAVKKLIDDHVPGVKKAWEFLEGPGVRATVDFVKHALR